MSIYTLGIDIGSTASKCVMLKDGKEIVAKSLIAVGAGTSGPQRAIAEVLEKAGKTEADMAYTLATGYGRNSLEDIADEDGYAFMGELGNLLVKKQPDFDPRNYGFSKLSKMIKSLDRFEVDVRQVGDNNTDIYVRDKQGKDK